MLDNFYWRSNLCFRSGEDMPQGFYRQLPKLVAGPLRGYPRIYDIAQRLAASNSDARLDLALMQRFISLYQDVRPLTTGELWALPVMLRYAVLPSSGEAASR